MQPKEARAFRGRAEYSRVGFGLTSGLDQWPEMRVEEGRQDSEEGPPARARGEPGRLPKLLWLAAGWLSLAAGFVGIFLPLLPTVPFVLLAAFCFSRGSARCERWLLPDHRHRAPHPGDAHRGR